MSEKSNAAMTAKSVCIRRLYHGGVPHPLRFFA
jgi:hypothetical protein